MSPMRRMQRQERSQSVWGSIFRRWSTVNGNNPKGDVCLVEHGGWPARRLQNMTDQDIMSVKSDDEINASLVCSINDSPYYIHKACSRGLIDVVTVLLSENPKRARDEDPKGLTCLHYAAGGGQVEIIRILLENNADINAKDHDGNIPLHTAVEKCQIGSIRELLSSGADGNILNNRLRPPLHEATVSNQPKLLEVLLEFPKLIDVNYRGQFGMRALHWAAKYDFAVCVEILLRNGCRICEPCEYGFYPIHSATKNSSLKALEAILKYGEECGYTRECMLSYADKESNSPLHLAVNNGNYDVVRICLEHGAKIDLLQESQATAFHFACSQGNLNIVKLMFEHHLKQRGEMEGRTILAALDNAEMTPLHRAAMFDHSDVVKYLIDQGSDINAIDRQKCSPLLLAATKGATRSARLLVEAGANIELKDFNQRHILHFPVMYNSPKAKEAMEIIDLVCQREDGLRLLNMKDSCGYTPLHVASKEGHLKFAEALIKLGAIINSKDNHEQSPLHFAAMYGRYNTVRRLLDTIKGRTILNETDSKGMTALHMASANGHHKVVELLLQGGALLHRNLLGQTPLHLASTNGYTHTMKLLLTFHATLMDIQCKKGFTALHYACEENQAEAAALLLSSDCAYLKDNEGASSMDIAIQRRNTEVATAMVQSDRWKEIVAFKSVHGCPLVGSVQHLPEVCKTILDRCWTKWSSDQTSKDYGITYNFEFMQIPLEKLRAYRESGLYPDVKPLMALNLMVQYGRVELLSHPVCLRFLWMKWNAYGMWFFLIHMLLYLTFVGCMTIPIMIGNENNMPPLPDFGNDSNSMRNDTNLTDFNSGQGERTIDNCWIATGYLMIFAVLNMVKELFQIYHQRTRYIFDYINYVEWTMYISTLLFAVPAFFYQCVGEGAWQCGSVAVFLAWFNLLLYLQRLESVGLYVVMFLQILNTVLKVVVVFTVLFVAFGLAFFMLLSATASGSFRTPFFSIVQALMYLMGEYSYVDVYVRPYFQLDGAQPLKYATLNFVFLVVFVILMPILFVNLLIGLAVGDIEMVQRDARLKRLAMQVAYHTELEEKLPLYLLKKVDKTEMRISPHASDKKGWFNKLCGQLSWICEESIIRSHADAMWRSRQVEASNEAIVEDLDNLRRRMKEIQTKTGNMHELLRLIVQKMEIVTEADSYEGRRLSDEDDEDSAVNRSARRRTLRWRAKITPLTLGKSMEH